MMAERATLEGVSGALPASAATSLDQAGFVVLPGPFPAERFDVVADAYDAEIQSAVTDDVRVGSTSTRVTDFVNRGPVFDPLYVYPPLLDAAALVVGRGFKLSSLHARTLHMGADVLDIHVDVERDSRDWPLLGFILMIDAFGPDNGATRFLPGSHQWTSSPRGARLQDYAARLVPACGPAGSLLVFNGRRGTARASTTPAGHAGRYRAHLFRTMAVRPPTSRTACRPRRANASAPSRSTCWRSQTWATAYRLVASNLGSLMKVAALQAPLPSVGTAAGLALIRRRVDQCEAEGVTVLCCPEAVVGGLADYAPDPLQIAVTPPPFWRGLARQPTRG